MDAPYSLWANGVQVVPILGSRHECEAVFAELQQTINAFPEYNTTGTKRQSSIGRFGALGNPSSFHAPFIRYLRYKVLRRLQEINFFTSPEGIHMFSRQLFDRLCVRDTFTQGAMASESKHFDIAPNRDTYLADGVFVLGGWLNLNVDSVQYFECFPGHIAPPNTPDGFTPDSDVVGDPTRVPVPPGCLVVFRQDLLHSVAKCEYVNDHRLFVSHMISADRGALERHYPYSAEEFARDMTVPPLPSGQVVPMFSSNHFSTVFSTKKAGTRYHMRGDKAVGLRVDLDLWAREQFKPAFLMERTNKNGEKYFTPLVDTKRRMTVGVSEYYPAYCEVALAAFSTV